MEDRARRDCRADHTRIIASLRCGRRHGRLAGLIRCIGARRRDSRRSTFRNNLHRRQHDRRGIIVRIDRREHSKRGSCSRFGMALRRRHGRRGEFRGGFGSERRQREGPGRRRPGLHVCGAPGTHKRCCGCTERSARRAVHNARTTLMRKSGGSALQPKRMQAGHCTGCMWCMFRHIDRCVALIPFT